MDEDAGHKAMLYYLEVLMNSNGPLSISQLAGRFGSRTFTQDMRLAAGGNEAGLRKFLLRYPSLFKVDGNLVSLNDSSSTPSHCDSPPDTPNSTSSSSFNALPKITDLTVETDAVLYFQGRLAKKDEKWVPVKSLAGHLSQANHDVRDCVGPQNEFKKFLLKHPHVFEVQGELVSLRDSFSSVTYNKKDINKITAARPKNLKFATRSHSSPITPSSLVVAPMAVSTPTTPNANRPGPLTMTANEYKAVMFIKNIIERKGNMALPSLTEQCSQAPDSVRKTLGYEITEVEQFLKLHDNMFAICSTDNVVSVKKTPKLHVIITGSRPVGGGPSLQTLANKRGKIFHVAKLWGIVDLGKHEHVFFDRSIYHKSVEDFQAEFRVGEWLNFNSVLAPKDSRAKWKATHVWKDGEMHPDLGPSSMVTTELHLTSGGVSPSTSIEDELCRLLPSDFEISKQLKDDPFADATPSETGLIPMWNERSNHHKPTSSSSNSPSLSPILNINMVPESYYMCAASMDDLQSILPSNLIQVPNPAEVLKPQRRKTSAHGRATSVSGSMGSNGDVECRNGGEGSGEPWTRSVACQTISTGEIMATQLYHDGDMEEKTG